MSDRTTIGEYLRSRRIKAGLTFRYLSLRSGISTTLLYNIESGKTEPKLRHIEQLSKALGESPIKLLRKYYSGV